MLIGGTVRSTEEARLLKEMGLNFGEISIATVKQFKNSLPRYRHMLHGSNFFYLCHGPQEGDPNNILALETIYLPKLAELIPLVRKVGSKVLTIHLWMDPRFVSKEAIEYKIGFLGRVLSLARRHKIRLNIENLSESYQDLATVFKTLPDLGLTLDVGHAQLLTQENRSHGFIQRFPERIRHLHIHDNMGGNSAMDDLHLPVGEGIVNFAAIFRALVRVGYHGTLTIELAPEKVRESLQKVKELLKIYGLG